MAPEHILQQIQALQTAGVDAGDVAMAEPEQRDDISARFQVEDLAQARNGVRPRRPCERAEIQHAAGGEPAFPRQRPVRHLAGPRPVRQIAGDERNTVAAPDGAGRRQVGDGAVRRKHGLTGGALHLDHRTQGVELVHRHGAAVGLDVADGRKAVAATHDGLRVARKDPAQNVGLCGLGLPGGLAQPGFEGVGRTGATGLAHGVVRLKVHHIPPDI